MRAKLGIQASLRKILGMIKSMRFVKVNQNLKRPAQAMQRFRLEMPTE